MQYRVDYPIFEQVQQTVGVRASWGSSRRFRTPPDWPLTKMEI